MLAKRATLSELHLGKRQRLREIIKAQSFLGGRDFLLSSGRESTYYFDMKKTTLDPEGGELVGDLVYEMIAADDVRFIGGLAMGAIPIVTAVAIRSWRDRPVHAFYVRDEVKNHGTKEQIYGFIEEKA